MASTTEILTEGIIQHTGNDNIKPADVKFHHDPKVGGTIAVRVENFHPDTRPGEPTHEDFLLVLGEERLTVDAVFEYLEGVEFNEWPPKSGEPKFFW